MKTSIDRPTRILDAASRLIVHYGFDKTTMEDIAREAGVSKGALYLVWPGKDALLDALIAYEMKRLLEDLRMRLQADPQGGRIAHLYKHTLLALNANPLVRALYTRDGRILGDFIHRQDVSRYTSRLALSADVVRQMQTAGLLDAAVRPEVVAHLFGIIALGFASIGEVVPAESTPPLEEIADALTALMERGLARPGGDDLLGKQAIDRLIDYMESQNRTESREE
jgi:AcrR family transcriptional regulator